MTILLELRANNPAVDHQAERREPAPRTHQGTPPQGQALIPIQRPDEAVGLYGVETQLKAQVAFDDAIAGTTPRCSPCSGSRTWRTTNQASIRETTGRSRRPAPPSGPTWSVVPPHPVCSIPDRHVRAEPVYLDVSVVRMRDGGEVRSVERTPARARTLLVASAAAMRPPQMISPEIG